MDEKIETMKEELNSSEEYQPLETIEDIGNPEIGKIEDCTAFGCKCTSERKVAAYVGAGISAVGVGYFVGNRMVISMSLCLLKMQSICTRLLRMQSL